MTAIIKAPGASEDEDSSKNLRKLRLVLGFFIVALILSGITAFPLLREMDFLCSISGVDKNRGAGHWFFTVRDGLRDAYGQHPWLAYGTDWLAFAHLVLAVFFLGPLVKPVRNIWVLQAGLAACMMVIPLALVAGPLRGIPWGWRLIDCSFGLFGALPLYYCLRLARQIERLEQVEASLPSAA